MKKYIMPKARLYNKRDINGKGIGWDMYNLFHSGEVEGIANILNLG